MKKNIFFKKKNIKLNQLFPKHKFKKNFRINEVKSLSSAGENDITFFDSINYKETALNTKAKLCITL